MRLVEGCKNWRLMYAGHGKHCYNCINRDGYPFRGQPSKECRTYEPIKKAKKVK